MALMDGDGAVGAGWRGARQGAVLLLVEPSEVEAERLSAALAGRGIAVYRADTAAQAKAMTQDLRPDVIVMELALPDADGLVLCADLRPRGGAPIVVYTRQQARERVLSLRLGADDAIAKSTDLDEVLARIEVALRRASRGQQPGDRGEVAGEARRVAPRPAKDAPNDKEAGHGGERFQRMDDLLIDRLLGRVTVAGQALYVSATEYRLLSLFLSRPGEVLSREELSDLLFGLRHVRGSRSIDMHVRRLRAKLTGLAAEVPALPVVRGLGYRLVPKGALRSQSQVAA